MKLYLFYLINLSMFSLIAMDNPYPLHSAAAKGDAHTCWTLLTDISWLPKPLPQDALYPVEAFEQLSKKNCTESSEAAVTKFLKTMEKLVAHHMARVNVLRTAINQEALTPYECAQKTNYPHFLCWFDPVNKQANNEINNDVVDKLNKALTGGVCGLAIALKKHDHQGYCDPEFKKTDNK